MQLLMGDTSAGLWYIWEERIKLLDFAFQPIVNNVTGKIYAVEALLRCYKEAGFDTIDHLFDTAYKEAVLFRLDIALRDKAVEKFTKIPFYQNIKLFYNYDPRSLEMPDYIEYSTERILEKHAVKHDQFCFEINEKYKITCFAAFNRIFDNIKKRGIKVAIDDFGSGFAGLELFYHSDPDFIKFDRFLISAIDCDIKKKIFCSHIISLAKMLGVVTIAEGIEKEAEFRSCKELGFDMVQGFYLQRPMLETDLITSETLSEAMPPIIERRKLSDSLLIEKQLLKIDTVTIHDDFSKVFEKFHDRLQFNFFPVVDSSGYPLGIIHEKDIKKYVYSPYGKEILVNKSISKSIKEFISKCPVADIHMAQDKILELYVNHPDSEGIIITKEMKYYGLLTAKSLLTIIHEKNIRYAVEINPLTKLPGNAMIDRFIEDSFNNEHTAKVLVYFDFDNFKPFNDRFGFRQGDKAITLFAEMLKQSISTEDHGFAGHIGGDDFFAGFTVEDLETEKIAAHMCVLVKEFSDNVAPFYPPEDFKQGYYFSSDRYGNERCFELLTVSAAILIIKSGTPAISKNKISDAFATLKSAAKKSPQKCVTGELNAFL